MRFYLNSSLKSVVCVKSPLNVWTVFFDANYEGLVAAFCLCYKMSISIMRRDLQGVFHLGSLLGDKK